MKWSLLLILITSMLLFSACGTNVVTEPDEQTPSTNFTISNLSISPTEINTGEQITISVLTANNGDIDGDYRVIFKIDDIAIETVDVPLASGEIKQVDFAATVDYDPGIYYVNVNGLLDTFTVKTVPPSPKISDTVSAMAIYTISQYDHVIDAAVYQDKDELSLVIIVNQDISEEEAMRLGDNFVRLVKSLSEDDPPGKYIGTGIYRYLISVYGPGNTLIAMGAKVKTATYITWD